MSNDKRSIIFKLTRVYKYPFAMLSRNSPLQDASEKLDNDFLTDIREMLQGNHQAQIREKFFNVEVIEEMPFTLQTKNDPRGNRDAQIKISIERLTQKLAMAAMVNKYHGQIDPESSPHLYESRPSLVRRENGAKVVEKPLFLKKDVEMAYLTFLDYYSTIVNNIETI